MHRGDRSECGEGGVYRIATDSLRYVPFDPRWNVIIIHSDFDLYAESRDGLLLLISVALSEHCRHAGNDQH